MENIKLKTWQKEIIDTIENYEDFIGQENMQGLSEYEKNEASSVYVRFPKGSGHSFLTSYISCNYPSVIIYEDIENWKNILKCGKVEETNIHPETSLVSIYEISHEILSTFRKDGGFYLDRVKSKMIDKKVVVIDNATSMMRRFPQVVDFLFNFCKGQIVLLG